MLSDVTNISQDKLKNIDLLSVNYYIYGINYSKMNISEKIKKVRQLKGYKQEYMADKLGVSQKQYSMYENIDANLEWHTIEKIATALDIDAVKLVGFDETQIFNNCNQSGNIFSSTLNNVDKDIVEELRNQLKEKDEQIKLLLSKI